MTGWIKLHRKILENPIFRTDPTAWHVFETLLVLSDRKGAWSGGRFQLAELCHFKPATVYAALRRLEKAKMITLDSNNRFTTISICKWQEYQGSDNNDDNNRITTGSQQDNNEITLLQEYKNIRKKEKVTTNVVTKNPEVEEVITAFKTQVGRMRRERYQAAAASKLLGEYGRERTLAAIVAVVGSKGRPYAPGITNLEDLWDKWPNLESFFRRESGKANKVLEV